MNQKLFLAFFLSFFCLITNAQKITSIEINGLNSISRGTVLNYLPIEAGDDIEAQTIINIKKSLEETRFFKEINLNFEKDILKISLIENPIITYFDIKGFKEDEVLNEEIVLKIKQNFSLDTGKIFLQSNLDKLINQLESLYRSKGFYETKISSSSTIDKSNRVSLKIDINEGNRAKIKKFTVTGNVFFDDEEILDKFEIGEPDNWLINWFTEKDYYSSQEFDSGLNKLSNEYLNNGFLDIKISKQVKYDKFNSSINIELFLSEGSQYLTKEIRFTDSDDRQSKKLRSLIDLKDNEYLDRKKLIIAVNKIARYFQDLGYTYAQIKSDIKKINSNELLVNIEIDKNLKTYIERIEISGNNRTQDDVIRRKLKLVEGQIYSKTDLDKSIQNIKRLGYFSDVTYELLQGINNKDKVTLAIRVTEQKTGEINIGLSHSNSTGAAITAGISQNNILGTGNTLNAALSNSDAVKETSFYFKDPHFNSSGHSVSYGLFDKSINAANLDASEYTIGESGLIFGYGIPLSDYSNIFAESRISSINLTCGASLQIYESTECNSNDKLDSKISLTYSSDSLNDFYFPTDGTKALISSSVTFPGLSDFKYFQIESSYKNYSRIFEDKTLKLGSRLNLASGYGGDSLPFFKRYYEGGASSIRGFDFNSLGSKYPNGKPKGGELSFVSTVAIGSSLDFMGLDNPNMKGSVFIDAGTISDKYNDLGFSNIRSSTGVQFSWLTPIGPLGFNFATPIIQKSNDSKKTFSFELGSKF